MKETKIHRNSNQKTANNHVSIRNDFISVRPLPFGNLQGNQSIIQLPEQESRHELPLRLPLTALDCIQKQLYRW